MNVLLGTFGAQPRTNMYNATADEVSGLAKSQLLSLLEMDAD